MPRVVPVRAVALAVELERALAHLAGSDEALEHRRVFMPDLGERDPRRRDELAGIRLHTLAFAFLLRLRHRAVEDLRALAPVDAPEDQEPRRIRVVAPPKDARGDALTPAALPLTPAALQVRAMRARLALHGSDTSYAGPGALLRCRGI
jgi:hypothetical protein